MRATIARTASRPLCLMTLCVLFAGCQTEPFTGRTQFNITPRSQELSMGLAAWKDVVGRETLSTNREQIAMVERVGRNIAAVVGEEDHDWEFKVFESEEANAFCLPGGKIAVYSGLFDYVHNEAELAAVVGHEIGHEVARHGGERMTEAMVMQVGAVALAVALNDKPTDQRARWLAAYAGISTYGFLLPYSRRHEYSADHIGLMYMAKAGYDPRAAVHFWTRFSEGKPSGGIANFMSTHPVGAKRIENLQQLMSKAIIEYEMAPTRRGLGEIVH